MKNLLFYVFILLTVVPTLSCGVKGPPLPPVAKTPQQSDLMQSSTPKPLPSLFPNVENQENEEGLDEE